ncbi:uncharacterized protein B0P05DRAFT_456202, partial [Gilbertella persicaria]|uniref:uncharacterized protein n=1 Tax=Gilbertella persicaria TaxID=101096 RepID=UPI002220C3DB
LNHFIVLLGFMKSKIKHSKLSNVKTLRSRIIKACEAILLVHLQNFIRFSVKRFGCC